MSRLVVPLTTADRSNLDELSFWKLVLRPWEDERWKLQAMWTFHRLDRGRGMLFVFSSGERCQTLGVAVSMSGPIT